MKRTFYQILELQVTATDKEIKQAFRNLAKKYHPDANIGNEENAKKQMQEVAEAYTILSDPRKRREYDNQLKQEGKYHQASETTTSRSTGFTSKNNKSSVNIKPRKDKKEFNYSNIFNIHKEENFRYKNNEYYDYVIPKTKIKTKKLYNY